MEFATSSGSLYGVPYTGSLPADYRLTWTFENPDQYRGFPFRRWLRDGPDQPSAFWIKSGEIAEIVEVPIGAKSQRHLESVWKLGYPVAWKWFLDESNTMLRYNGIVFVKADW